jgi:DNA primase catalytic core
MLDKIVESCQYLLQNYPEAQDCKSYLDSRLTQESQDRFQFGFFPGIMHLPVLVDMVGEDTLYKEKLLYSRKIEDTLSPRTIQFCYFENHPLILPFRNNYGEIVALVGRTMLPEPEWKALKLSKYKNTAESPTFKKGNLLFGLYENKQSIMDQNCVYIVEGQFDVIKANEKGFNNIVALGNSHMSAYQFSVISRYTDNIFLLLDNDVAGQKGRKRIIEKFGKLANIRNFYLPESYKDIDEYFTKSGEETVSFVVQR